MDFSGRKKQPDGKEIKERYPVALLHDVQFPCARNGLRPALYLELAVDRVDVPFHRTNSPSHVVCLSENEIPFSRIN